MNVSGILDFLKLLAANNNREWFHTHKSDYLKAQSDFENLLGEVIVRLSSFDETIVHVRPSDCTYRIYRDTRFSADKSPYKNYLGGYINARGKKSNHCGYYIHLEPGNCMLAGGSWCMPSSMLKAVRQSVCDNIEAFWISPDEIVAFEEKGGLKIGLGPRIMRAETAPLYALSSVSYALELLK